MYNSCISILHIMYVTNGTIALQDSKLSNTLPHNNSSSHSSPNSSNNLKAWLRIKARSTLQRCIPSSHNRPNSKLPNAMHNILVLLQLSLLLLNSNRHTLRHTNQTQSVHRVLQQHRMVSSINQDKFSLNNKPHITSKSNSSSGHSRCRGKCNPWQVHLVHNLTCRCLLNSSRSSNNHSSSR